MIRPTPPIAATHDGLLVLPPPLRGLLVGGALLGVLGGLTGLVLGLVAHPPTAWFAVLEVGVPAGILGMLLGLLWGTLAWAARGAARRHH